MGIQSPQIRVELHVHSSSASLKSILPKTQWSLWKAVSRHSMSKEDHVLYSKGAEKLLLVGVCKRPQTARMPVLPFNPDRIKLNGGPLHDAPEMSMCWRTQSHPQAMHGHLFRPFQYVVCILEKPRPGRKEQHSAISQRFPRHDF